MGRARRQKIKTRITFGVNDADGKKTTIGSVAAKKSLTTVQREHQDMLERRNALLIAMPASSRAIANQIVVEHGAPPDDPSLPTYEAAFDDELEWVDEEDLPDLSHEGGELSETARAAVAHVIDPSSLRRYQRSGIRNHAERRDKESVHWNEQMEDLVDTYLHWKHQGATSINEDVETTDPMASRFVVVAAYTHKQDIQKVIVQRPEERANVALIRCGLLGTSPIYPETAISLETLELYHRLRRHHPQLGIQPMVRALCDVYDVNYRKHFRTQFSTAFDVYLNILQIVDQRCAKALGRDDPHWRIKHSCPCCHLQLQDEVALHPARLLAMDGNNSAKRVASAGAQDRRRFKSDYFLPRDVVDHFKDEVKRRIAPASSVKDMRDASESEEEDAPWAPTDRDMTDEGGDVTDGQAKPTPCADHWKASAAENLKRALDIYETTGIFVCACRHGFIQIACEMVRSGELAKYPLALLDHILDMLGDNTALGYDIGCTFKETVARSSLVGPKAALRQVVFAVCAFHGYAHNRQCQLANHPLYLIGFGLEDLEGLERVFSGSNAVARLIRYASRYHWTQALDLHFRHWDDEKYCELSKFLYNNARQALTLIHDYSGDVKQLQAELDITDADIEGWAAEERAFLEGLKEEPEERILEAAYVQALIDREKADQAFEKVRKEWVATPCDKEINYAQDARRTIAIEADRRAALEGLTLAMNVVGDLEKKLAVETPWTPADPKYQDTLAYVRHREFHRALDKVQQLVMQRLLELSKANMSGTSYKTRTSIWKALKTRGKAIRAALKKYNVLALQMSPPAPALLWKDVVTYSFIGEFDLLRNAYSRRDILASLWTTPRNREVAVKYFKILRAREELKRVDHEVCRLETSIELERREYELAIHGAATCDTDLASELRARSHSRRRVQTVHIACVAKLRTLPGYTGTTSTEMRPPSAERDYEIWEAAACLQSVTRSDHGARTELISKEPDSFDDEEVGGDDVFDDPVVNEELIRLTEVMETLSMDR
ncbi:hypothetical protein C8Q78DRAFT_1019556 [Trametes maxima]|nr:hypothetical protein C8Q78DRAFT_1029750 [Trametes maxima]KAI0671895.1 hypothetical protein C8Q78DRAFT_1031327 [Trametes maxima]KAI0672814.1 hypothetical protein C8Q78DRAFT_1021527 [Trametes maxima]KAI0673876.1 hypothetical protein C8Q78DRAFT_1019556 [Trametes maxima]